jgi:hypothetical protein
MKSFTLFSDVFKIRITVNELKTLRLNVGLVDSGEKAKKS